MSNKIFKLFEVEKGKQLIFFKTKKNNKKPKEKILKHNTLILWQLSFRVDHNIKLRLSSINNLREARGSIGIGLMGN